MSNKYKRKINNYFLKKNFQGRLALAFFLAGLAGCISIILVLNFLSLDTLTISYQNNSLEMGQTPLMLFKNTLMANWLIMVIGGTVLVLAVIIGTHRIAGPLFRFEKTLSNMEKGRLNDTIILRKNDGGKTLARQINNFNDTLSSHFLQIHKNTSAIDSLIDEFEKPLDSSPSSEKTLQLLQAMKNNSATIKDTLNHYTYKE